MSWISDLEQQYAKDEAQKEIDKAAELQEQIKVDAFLKEVYAEQRIKRKEELIKFETELPQFKTIFEAHFVRMSAYMDALRLMVDRLNNIGITDFSVKFDDKYKYSFPIPESLRYFYKETGLTPDVTILGTTIHLSRKVALSSKIRAKLKGLEKLQDIHSCGTWIDIECSVPDKHGWLIKYRDYKIDNVEGLERGCVHEYFFIRDEKKLAKDRSIVEVWAGPDPDKEGFFYTKVQLCTADRFIIPEELSTEQLEYFIRWVREPDTLDFIGSIPPSVLADSNRVEEVQFANQQEQKVWLKSPVPYLLGEFLILAYLLWSLYFSAKAEYSPATVIAVYGEYLFWLFFLFIAYRGLIHSFNPKFTIFSIFSILKK